MTNNMDMTNLTFEQASWLLSKAGAKDISVQQIRDAVDDGAPVTDDHTINLIHFSAWLTSKIIRKKK